MVGVSGARLVLEMARRGRSEAVLALEPSSFGESWDRGFARATLTASAVLLRSLRPALPKLA
jgi:hypothetical protein